MADGDWASAIRGALFGRKPQDSVPMDFWLSDSRRAAPRRGVRHPRALLTHACPTRSCLVCYECDQPFSLLVRRHHCRVCGRIFCSRCTSKSLPSTAQGGDAIRVCNFCARPFLQASALREVCTPDM